MDMAVTWFYTRPLVILLGRSERFTQEGRFGIARGLAVKRAAPDSGNGDVSGAGKGNGAGKGAGIGKDAGNGKDTAGRRLIKPGGVPAS